MEDRWLSRRKEVEGSKIMLKRTWQRHALEVEREGPAT